MSERKRRRGGLTVCQLAVAALGSILTVSCTQELTIASVAPGQEGSTGSFFADDGGELAGEGTGSSIGRPDGSYGLSVEAGSPLELCPDGGVTVCDADCGGSACNVACRSNATCNVNCQGSADCRVTCAPDSSCFVDCRGGADCTQITCAPGAICELKCDVGQPCAFAMCSYPTQCTTDGTYDLTVCNQACP